MSIIKVNNISKKYIIGHDKNAVVQYKTLRDSLTHTARGIYQRFRHPLSINKENTEIEEFWALKNISFEVDQGDKIGIIGRNGAGKSTLLKILSRITEPSHGEFEINGRVASLLEVGTGFHPELSGRENIYLNGAVLGMTRREVKQKFDEIVAFAEIEKFLDTPVKRYSSGMYVRLAFSVAAHLETDVLIVDEVLAVGDMTFQKKCLGKMNEVSNKGRTVLFVSHNMAAIQQLCTKGAIITNGSLVDYGPIKQITDKYISSSDLKTNNKGTINLSNKREKIYKSNIFDSVRILDKNDSPCEIFTFLSKFKLEVELANNENYPYMDYGVSIFNASGIRLTSFATWMLKEKVEVPKKIILEIPNINFSEGNYYISLSMTHPKEGGYIDKIEQAATFRITSTNIFNTGRTFESDYGVILPNGTLKLTT